MSDTNIDFGAIEAQLQNLDKDALLKLVVDARVKQRVATKKYYNADAAKLQRQKRAAQIKAAADLIAKMGLTKELEAQIDAGVAEALEPEVEETVQA